MFIVLKMMLAMAKRRKGQSVLIGIMFMLVAVLLFTSVFLLDKTSAYDIMYERANATSGLLIFNKDTFNVDKTMEWIDSQQEIQGTVTHQVIKGKISVEKNDEIITEDIFLFQYNEDTTFDLLYTSNATQASQPKEGEIMLNCNYARTKGWQVGDTVEIDIGGIKQALTISALVVDPQYNTPFATPNRCLVNSNYFEKHELEVEMVFLFVKYKEPETVDELDLIEQFTIDSQSKEAPFYISYQDFSAGFEMIPQIVAGILLAVALVLFFIIGLIINGIVQTIIRQQYREIGVKRALGYSFGQIKWAMTLYYGGLGIVAALGGACFAIPLTRFIYQQLYQDLKIPTPNHFLMSFMITVIGLVGTITLFIQLRTRSINRIKPVDAIKNGILTTNNRKTSFHLTQFTKVPISLLVAMKQLLSNKKRTLEKIVLMSTILFACLLLFSINNTVQLSKHFSSCLFGIEVGDEVLTTKQALMCDTVCTELEATEQVDEAVYVSMTTNGETVETPEGGKTSIGMIHVYGSIPENFIKIRDGRIPRNESEICISTKVAKETQKVVGDYITVISKNASKQFLITATFSTVMNSGVGCIRIMNEPEHIAMDAFSYYFVYNDEGSVNIDTLNQELSENGGELSEVEHFFGFFEDVQSSVAVFPSVVASVLMLLFIVSGIITANFNILEIQENMKMVGIFKAIGFSKQQLVSSLRLKNIMIACIAIIISFGLNRLLANVIFQKVLDLSPYDIGIIPIVFNLKGECMIALGFLAMSILIAQWLSVRINNISPREIIQK